MTTPINAVRENCTVLQESGNSRLEGDGVIQIFFLVPGGSA